MNDKKLKPEHRKLWRRVYLNEFEVQNQTPEASEAMADKVVAQWEARGAFDVGDASSALPNEPATPFAVRFPLESLATLQQLGPDIIGKHIEFGNCDDRNAIELRALTPYGEALLRVGLPHGSKDFVAAVRRLCPASPSS